MIEKRAMGRTGDKSSILGFGCMRLPLNGPKPNNIDYDLATQMVRKAIDNGVDYVDTAFTYHSTGRETPGESEPFLAHALKDGYREKVKLATKLPTWLLPTHAEMHKYLDKQLKFLGTHRIEYYLAHNLNTTVWGPMVENKIFEFFDEAVKDGRILYPSFSFHDEFPLFETIIESYDWAMAQIQYNYLDLEYQAGRAGLKLAANRGAAVVVMEPLRGGFLVKYMPEEPAAWLKEARPDWSLPAWALNWLWNQGEVSVVLSGMSAMPQVEENLQIAKSYQKGLFTEADQKVIERVLDYFEGKIAVACTACGYCSPCPSGLDIVKNLEFLNQYHLFDADEPRERSRFFYGMLLPPSERAENCTSCGDCVEKCPQHLEIPGFLAKTAELFKGTA
jgi:predicted aldo/keto reductase-like oxidoreductase